MDPSYSLSWGVQGAPLLTAEEGEQTGHADKHMGQLLALAISVAV